MKFNKFSAWCSIALIVAGPSLAQESPVNLPPIIVAGPSGADQTAGSAQDARVSPSLTVQGVETAKTAIKQTPGGVALVPAEAYRDTRAVTTKDVLDYVPGVFAQPKFGEDARLTIRGSGLSRNFHLRGIKLLQDGIPINLADGGGDFQEIDPLAFRYVEVFKGANGLQYGANSLGGVINFVSPTGRHEDINVARIEAGSFDFKRLQAAYGASHGAWDAFVTGSHLEQEGFREHSLQDSDRFNANLGYRISPNAETRFYATYNNIDQEIPGEVKREQALSNPEKANATNILRDTERNIESARFSNKTTVQLGGGVTLDFGAFYFSKHLDHPISPFIIDYNSEDYGAFTKLVQEGTVGGYRNRIVAGVNLHNGETDAKQYNYANASSPQRGILRADAKEKANNVEVFAENSFYLREDLVLIAGAQAGYAKRELEDQLLVDPPAFGFPDKNSDDSGSNSYRFFNPKIGFLWQAAPTAQVFGNVSKATEVPTFSELNTTFQPDFNDLKAQRALTVELGTRGSYGGIGWDVSVYRAWLDNELQLFSENGVTTALNADETIHQGLELGLSATLLRGLARADDSLFFRAAYTYSDFRFDDDAIYGDNELPGAPKHYLRAELLYKHPSGFYAGPNVEWVPEAYFVDNTNTVETEGYALLGARAGMDFESGLSVFIDGRNLTDEKYISSVSVAENFSTSQSKALFNPGDGRAVFGGLSYRW